MHDEWNGRLSEYADDELRPSERERLDQHLRGCERCRADLEDLRMVVTRARGLRDTTPAADLWPGIEATISKRLGAAASGGARRFTFTLPQLIAAGLALMVLSGGMVWLARIGGDRTDFPPVSAETAALPSSGAAPEDDRTIEALEQILAGRRGELGASRVRALNEQLAAADRAVEQCDAGLERDPANVYLRACVEQARARKLELLRGAVATLPVRKD
jgi:hypothetical protein